MRIQCAEGWISVEDTDFLGKDFRRRAKRSTSEVKFELEPLKQRRIRNPEPIAKLRATTGNFAIG